MQRIYLDHAATTAVRPEALEAMLPWLRGGDNPSSIHAEGRAARAALDDARERVARVLHVAPAEVVFTAGGSESDNLAILGAARAVRDGRRHALTAAIEHDAVLRAFDALEADGWDVTRVATGSSGVVAPEDVAAALRDDTALLSLAVANNELGTLQPVPAVADAARARGALVHTDAVQAAGWVPIRLPDLGVDLLSLAGHKVGGPKGAGVLAVRAGTPLVPLIVGGGQERGRRSGTENVAAAVGLAVALERAEAERAAEALRVAELRDRLAAGLLAGVPGLVVNVAASPRLPNHLSVAVPDAPADALLAALDLEGIAASAGSACAAGSLEANHVVATLGLAPRWETGVLRFSLGHTTTAAEIEAALARLVPVIRRAQKPPLSR